MDRKLTADEKNYPFFPWECITIQLKHRDIDLVIKDEHHMRMVLRYLIYTLNSIDGNKDSSIPLQTYIFKQRKSALVKKKVTFSEQEMKDEIRHQVMIQAAQKY